MATDSEPGERREGLADAAAAPPERRIPQVVRQFFETEASGGLVLLAAALVALVWANSPWRPSYTALWRTDLAIGLGRFALAADLKHWVNDGLMTLFFFVVGLEIKRELVNGDLRDRRAAALPVIAAAGGMAVPAALFLLFTVGHGGAEGWAIPMATDIAFAIGVVVLLGPRVPASLKLFLLTLAIVDDIGAIVVIAVFYATDVQPLFLAVAVMLLAGMVALRRAGVAWLAPYVALGIGVWMATRASGVHATIAGVVLGLLAPTRPLGERLEQQLHPWTSFLVVPLFALANAGVAISVDSLDAPGTFDVAAGVMLGLVVGKIVGITGASWLAVRSGLGRLPEGSTWLMLGGVAAIAGIGFTVSLFVAELAYDSGPLRDAAKIGVLGASLVAAILGALILRRACRRSGMGC
ncbi:MAG: Na+/H+ antiporter NhaA [Acidimicrobiales bacterium]